MKTCSKCEIEKDYSEFKTSIHTKDGYFNACKKCTRGRKKCTRGRKKRETKSSILDTLNKIIKATKKVENRVLRKDNKKICSGCEKIINSNMVYCKDCVKERRKNWNINNKESVEKYKQKNKDKILEYARQYASERRKRERAENNNYKEIQAEKMREYYFLNKERIKEYQKEYEKNNREKIRERRRELYHKKKLERLENESM